MGVFDRMGRVISSNFNSLLDKVDDPGKSIELILDKMQEEIRAARQEIVSAVASEKQLAEKAATLDAEVKKWESRAELALRRGDEDLARAALAQKQRLVGERDHAEALRAEHRAAAAEMKNELPRMEQKVKEFAARKSTLATQVKMARAGSGPETLGQTGSTSAFDEFRRMEDQIEGVEAAVKAQREVDDALGNRGPTGLSTAELEAKFRALETGGGGAQTAPDIEAELAVLKRKIRVSE